MNRHPELGFDLIICRARDKKTQYKFHVTQSGCSKVDRINFWIISKRVGVILRIQGFKDSGVQVEC